MHKPGTSNTRKSVPRSSFFDRPVTHTTTGMQLPTAEKAKVMHTRIPFMEWFSSNCHIDSDPLALTDSFVTSLDSLVSDDSPENV